MGDDDIALAIYRLSEVGKEEWGALLSIIDSEVVNAINECLRCNGDESTRAKGKVDALRQYKALLEMNIEHGRELRVKE